MAFDEMSTRPLEACHRDCGGRHRPVGTEAFRRSARSPESALEERETGGGRTSLERESARDERVPCART